MVVYVLLCVLEFRYATCILTSCWFGGNAGICGSDVPSFVCFLCAVGEGVD